jgi:hypothetical protein
MHVFAKRLVAATVMMVLTSCATARVSAQDKRVIASSGWVKLPEAGETQALAFVTVENPTMYEVYVTSAASAAAARIELRDAAQSADAREKAVMFIAVPAYGRIDMSRSGAHLMLLDLKRPLHEGDTIGLTLSTDIDVALQVSAPVRKE